MARYRGKEITAFVLAVVSDVVSTSVAPKAGEILSKGIINFAINNGATGTLQTILGIDVISNLIYAFIALACGIIAIIFAKTFEEDGWMKKAGFIGGLIGTIVSGLLIIVIVTSFFFVTQWTM
ncbi:MAG: hypothetical protein K5694_05370 [Bacilli bacterium]|nr:hypothetical protein [Bacilli bacterium]